VKNDWLKDRSPDFVVTDEQAVAEGVLISMDAWGMTEFHGEPVNRVSATLHQTLQGAFGRAATAGMSLADVREVYPDATVDDGLTSLVPPWAVLGELLAVYLATAKDTAVEGEPADWLYATDNIVGLGNRPVWLQRNGVDGWTAMFPSDY
jgi:hypothetical protein